jgi:hypothetical protein
MSVRLPRLDSYAWRIRAILYIHCLLIIFIGGIAYCEVMLDRPTVFKWVLSSRVGQWICWILMFASFCFPCILAELSGGRLPTWRRLLLVLVDFAFACIQFAILLIMLMAITIRV